MSVPLVDSVERRPWKAIVPRYTPTGASSMQNRLDIDPKAPTGATHRVARRLCRPCRGFVVIRVRNRGLTAPAKAVSAHSGLNSSMSKMLKALALEGHRTALHSDRRLVAALGVEQSRDQLGIGRPRR
jgi:hypothetical protein